MACQDIEYAGTYGTQLVLHAEFEGIPELRTVQLHEVQGRVHLVATHQIGLAPPVSLRVNLHAHSTEYISECYSAFIRTLECTGIWALVRGQAGTCGPVQRPNKFELAAYLQQ
jgi:hypothetical protein